MNNKILLLKKYKKIVKKINQYEPHIQKLTDLELKNKTTEFKTRLSSGEKINNILPEAFAVCKEASYRTIGLKHFDVQLLGGIALHYGLISEMKTGEGKTLVATCPAYLNALTEKGVHIITVNDYLAKRDMQQMSQVFHFLGLTTGYNISKMPKLLKQAAYRCDITYGTNSEFGFDYLRDNMAINKEDYIQRDLNFAIIDEIDSILIDEAKMPLIISNGEQESASIFSQVDIFVKSLKNSSNKNNLTKFESLSKQFQKETEQYDYDEDYVFDEEKNSIFLTEKGIQKAELYFHLTNYSNPDNMLLVHYITQSLKANFIMQKDKNYIVKDQSIKIIDESTGRITEGRKFSDNLHQAIEAKEGISINIESKTVASITYQNYFRMYQKLSGMTATASTEKQEFKSIYNLNILTIPTNVLVKRKDFKTEILSNETEKFNAILNLIESIHATGRPILIGTPSVEKSEIVAELLFSNGFDDFSLLNAKNNEEESKIISQAGKLNAITIATNMAGRGTDILLGGNPEFLAKEKTLLFFENQEYAENEYQEEFENNLKHYKQICKKEKEKVNELGGLYVIGIEKHDSRRIDDQLKGRAGRQGDFGSSKFFASLDDRVIRVFGNDFIKTKFKSSTNMDMNNRMYNKILIAAQKKIEQNNYQMRKSTLEYDDVNDLQRKQIYKIRKEIIEADQEKCEELMILYINEYIEHLFSPYEETLTNEDFFKISDRLLNETHINIPEKESYTKLPSIEKNICKKMIKQEILLNINSKKIVTKEHFSDLIKYILLKTIDYNWSNYLTELSSLKEACAINNYGSLKPIQLYKKESIIIFNSLIETIQLEFSIQFLYTNIEESLEEKIKKGL